MPWSDSPDYQQPVRWWHAVGGGLLIVAFIFFWAWTSSPDPRSAAHAGHPVATVR